MSTQITTVFARKFKKAPGLVSKKIPEAYYALLHECTLSTSVTLTWMQLMGPFSALVPVVVRLIHSPPPLGAASAARIHRLLAAVVSSLRERTR